MIDAGRDPEFERLYRDEFPRLVRGLSVPCGIESAADAVQEAFLRAGVRWKDISQHDVPALWVRRVALNLLLNERRSARRRRQIDDAVRPAEPVADPAEGQRIDLLDAVRQLSPQRRLAVGLYYGAGFSVDEVAEMLEVQPGTVKRYLYEARAQLKGMVSNGA